MPQATRILVVVLLAALWLPARAGTPAVASAHPLATEAGMEVLRDGGNAFDAAVTVSAVLAVVEPMGSGFGGGGFWLLHRERDGFRTMIDGRETAPGAATADMYLNRDGEVERDWAMNGPAAAAIPGQAAALDHIAGEYGTMELAELLAPAIELAEEGFEVGERYRTLARFRKEVLNRFPDTRRTFLRDGELPPKGHTIVQPELAQVLERLAEEGRDGFYTGEVAQALVEGVQEYGGIWTLEDLEDYEVREREPVTGEYAGAEITAASLPSSGGIVLMQIFNILSEMDEELEGADAGLRAHLNVEAMRRAYRDRAEYLGDSDFVDVPRERLMSREHARELASTIRLDEPTPSEALEGISGSEKEGEDTTHFSILDAEGNRVAATLTINYPFGSGFTVPGTGILLNNEMDDFSAKPGEPNVYGLVGSEANAIAPGKRPLSSMTPAFLDWEGNTAILGTPGGSRIITMVALAMQHALDGHDPEEWVSRPRYHHQYLPDKVEAEPDFIGTDTANELLRIGHEVESTGRRYGDMQVILRDSDGKVSAVSDLRGEGDVSTGQR